MTVAREKAMKVVKRIRQAIEKHVDPHWISEAVDAVEEAITEVYSGWPQLRQWWVVKHRDPVSYWGSSESRWTNDVRLAARFCTEADAQAVLGLILKNARTVGPQDYDVVAHTPIADAEDVTGTAARDGDVWFVDSAALGDAQGPFQVSRVGTGRKSGGLRPVRLVEVHPRRRRTSRRSDDRQALD